MKGRTALIQANFHTHTRRCHHAGGTDEEIVQAAIANGYKVLGFSDHAAWKYDSDYVPYMRMRLEEFDDYKRSVLELKEKYRGQIEILFGMEAEYFPRYMDWMLQFCVDQHIEYLILGNHFYRTDETGPYFGRIGRDMFDTYVDSCIQGLETGMFSYLAHPELPLRSLDWDEDMIPGFTRICQYCHDNEIPLEYNVLGMQASRRKGKEMYPNHHFWQIAGEWKCKAVIGMDAHHPKDLRQNLYQEARRKLSRYDVELTDTIRMANFNELLDKRRQFS